MFVAMPARKAKQYCQRCGKKVDIGSHYCNYCGGNLPLAPKDSVETTTRQAAHQDLAHPINQQFRDYLQSKVLDSYHSEKSNPSPVAAGQLDREEE